jgi:hypothetical protein
MLFMTFCLIVFLAPQAIAEEQAQQPLIKIYKAPG